MRLAERKSLEMSKMFKIHRNYKKNALWRV